ncbi:MAG TPA: hypothetical protein QF499_01005 [Gammaproteobacteria bacterium]|jgi:hypothetical protein|nr:hypothetical protein [Gammaproteobacteria bacterium]MDP7659625.1 hypothetical protein [Gammaproteobacteria bacterium]HJP37691.1 hypothetical protein [Gammaproteobacteria bacterium]
MSKRVQDVAPPRTEDAKKWLKQNVAEQKKRHRAIMKEMNVDVAPQRVKWYKRFLRDVSTTGFNVTGDMKRVIPKKDLPKQPKRKDKVVF